MHRYPYLFRKHAAVTGCTAPDAASMTAVPRPSRLAVTAWVTPDTYTAPVPDDVSITVPTLPPKMRFPVLGEPHMLSLSISDSQRVC